MPAPAPKMTTRSFSRWRMARRGCTARRPAASRSRTDPRLDALLLEEVLQGETVHHGAEHAHVVGPGAPCRAAGARAAEEVAAADDDGDLDTAAHRVGDLLGDADTTAGSRPMRPPPKTSPESLRRTRWKGVVWASVMAQGLLEGTFRGSVDLSTSRVHRPHRGRSGGEDPEGQRPREARVVVLVVVGAAASRRGHARRTPPAARRSRLRTAGATVPRRPPGRRDAVGQRDEPQAGCGRYAAVRALGAERVPHELRPTHEEVRAALDLLPPAEGVPGGKTVRHREPRRVVDGALQVEALGEGLVRGSRR